MRPIPPADMILFAIVVREGSFTRAARQLGITKQTVSERIAKLEERLGVRLLERTTRRLRVTDPGAIYSEPQSRPRSTRRTARCKSGRRSRWASCACRRRCCTAETSSRP
jgi:hypothetical protein